MTANTNNLDPSETADSTNNIPPAPHTLAVVPVGAVAQMPPPAPVGAEVNPPGVVPAAVGATPIVPPVAGVPPERTTMNGKPELWRENIRTVITLKSEAFQEKKLCDGLTFNLGDACQYSCEYCYVEASMRKLVHGIIGAHNERRAAEGETEPLDFHQVVVRRRNAIQVLRGQLFDKEGRPKYNNPEDQRTIYSSTLVDVAANMTLLRETAEACNLILEHTNWHIRLLSKSSILHLLVKNGLIPEKYHGRLIFGFSTGTLDDRVAKAIESGTPLVSKRLESLHWLQDNRFRTFGMICPSLPQTNYAKFSREICEAIRVDRCEHVWAEVINVRGESLVRTLAGLEREGLHAEAGLVRQVSDPDDKTPWEQYARETFLAHTGNIPLEKLRFLQYVTAGTADWWAGQRAAGAVLLGKVAQEAGLNPLPPRPNYQPVVVVA